MTQNSSLPSPSDEALNGFDALGLHPLLCRATQKLGFIKPTPIQQKGIPPLLQGKDVLLPSQTGSGKTATFLLAALQRLADRQQEEGEFYHHTPTCLILEPTRDLAHQTAGICRQLARDLSFRTRVLCGGTSREQQLNSMKEGVDIIIATHGRLLDFVQKGELDLSQIDYLVLDEADRLLDEEFTQSMTALIPYLGEHPQTIFCSATLPDTVRHFAKKVTRNPVAIDLEEETKTPIRLQQRALFLHEDEKEALTRKIISHHTPGGQIIIFVNTKKSADELARKIRSWGFKAASFHSDLKQNDRTKVLEQLQTGTVSCLVTTDIAARGLDLDELSLVINVDLPKSPELYIHRIGRSARAGRKGKAISLVTGTERQLLREIEQTIHHRIRIITPETLDK
ncbi:DEAD/DEAH box helicase [Acetobacteraceae bacterium ESL0709]|nr:DEAD/DEAH box helicase [Acetobacteraceae bacterium ESL0697]MDF7677949.1 DEAD/DEAH box helicase [Acetobacteraceae bacterium ESL0709]